VTAVRVLVVEDERTTREGVQLLLERSGFDVRSAGDADHAISEADDWPPDVLVCDWRLGGRRDGVDVARAIQGSCGSEVIFITSHPLEALRRNANDVTVRYFLNKPVLPTVLIDALHSVTPRV
jgi:DNA-binding response OmpR family regulator